MEKGFLSKSAHTMEYLKLSYVPVRYSLVEEELVCVIFKIISTVNDFQKGCFSHQYVLGELTFVPFEAAVCLLQSFGKSSSKISCYSVCSLSHYLCFSILIYDTI